MASSRVCGGVVHKLPTDLRKALLANDTALAAWNDITPLARNEFICWVEDAKEETTRERRIRRTQEELEGWGDQKTVRRTQPGLRRPPLAGSDFPNQFRAWVGMRPRYDSDYVDEEKL
ncbi:YdeI/OmpD-associated family protein [Mycobacterium colombiense]|uniref:YdeI/OmpD-associated family protein n=1 Tax=Mycobacterium colombiense TaxID=339268 RepID=UPI000C2C73A2